MSAGIPEGWSYEGPDPEVGWFNGYWIHEDCAEADEQRVVEEIVSVSKQGDTRITTYKMTCSCGDTMQAEDSDYDPDEMPVEAFREEEALVEGER